MEQPRHSRVDPAGQRVEVKVERHQLLLLFVIALVVVALVFSVGVMTGKRLTGLAAGDCKGDLKTVDKAAEVEKALKKGEPAQQGGASPGSALAQLAATAKEQEPPKREIPPRVEKPEKEVKEPAPEKQDKTAKEAKAAPEKTHPERATKPDKEGTGPPVKEPAAPPEGASAGEAVEYCVQVAALPDRNQAVALAAQMEKKGYQTHISTTQVAGKGTMYRVRLGRFKSKEEANAFRDEFQKKENKPGFVTPTK